MRVVDLFAGCGGLSKGLENAGCELTLAVENWEAARKVYEENFDHPALNLDLSGVKEATKVIAKECPDMIVGGPPCQEFSFAGSRVEGPRARLTIHFAEIIDSVKPKWFVLENVQGIRNSATWIEARKILEDAGYGITESVLNAAYFGVPQKRRRFFAIGCLGETHDFLVDQLEAKQSEEPLTVRQYVGDEFGIDFYYRHPRNWGRRGVFSLDEASPTIRSTNRNVPPGYFSHPEDAGSHLEARALTTAERARVQTFERTFTFLGTDTAQNTMIANAVPVKLAEHIAITILRHEKEQAMYSDLAFRKWLASSQHYTPRTAGNIVSRLKRASRILHTDKLSIDPLDVIHALERSGEFVNLPSSVKSQIKKAIRLHADFHQR
ncbi:DNA cytosine methyltransferase [Chromobacterium haemolyticum]|uniref:DNA cytosine methyltransferase n=1 Tax=Chromobacterium haemolyticum TaxID=394935 RepID=UPI0009FC749B|nr:DNA cytosine methyltransferase [Chromobacterium haemolyticum]